MNLYKLTSLKFQNNWLHLYWVRRNCIIHMDVHMAIYMWMNIYSHEHVYVCGHFYVYIVSVHPLNSIEHSTCKYK